MKRFIIKTLFYFIPFICLYGGYKIINKYYISGDLGELGQIPFGKNYYENLKRNHLTDNLVINTRIAFCEKFRPENVSKIFTIGDSFSQQKIAGYQNYLGHLLEDSIINITKNGEHFETVISLLNSGFIDSTICKVMVIEQVDRYAIVMLNYIDFEKQYNLPDDDNQDEENRDKDFDLYNFCSWIRLQFGYDSPVFRHNLKQDCFSHYFSRKLFHYIEDYNFKQTKAADIEKAKENLILLNKKFSEKGIKLILLIAADKYDVYRPFMTDNSLPVDTTTDWLSNLPDVFVIDTKSILQEMVRNGEKDVYMINDTHWSYKASEAVAKKIFYDIKNKF